ncbi:MAG: fluoride efflux transporter CrcB [Gemmatimonadales bacterium]
MGALLAVALGGALGSVLRYGVGAALLRPGLSGLPWGTFAVNVTGSLALGFLARYFGPPYGAHGSEALFLALTVGLCGGYTTFSTFTLDMLTMVERGEIGRAALYAALSVLIGFAALALGYQAARALRPLP